MTITTPAGSGNVPAEQGDDLVTLTIDGVEMTVPKGTQIIRAAEQIGVAVPRFCDHPLLDPVAACRMCLVEVEGMPKPQPACAVACGDGMVVRTQVSSEMADDAQRSVMEFLLINHPLDCPVCDKGGECPLQNQAMSNGQAETRFDGPKRTFPKPINLSAQVLLDRERCVSCARCTRFADEIAGDPLIELLDRGSQQQVGIATDKPFNSYFSGNTIQICPVGALTSSMYRFRSRPFDLVSTPTACEHCASGCAQRTDSRRNTIVRRMAAVDPEVNEEWNCDKGRFAFRYVESADRLERPMIREDGELRLASWGEALDAAAAGLARNSGKVGLIAGGRLSADDALAYSAFARVVLNTNNVDFRARPASPEEEQFLAAHVAGAPVGPTYADLQQASTVMLVAFEPEDESPIVHLRLRKAARAAGTQVVSIAATASAGLKKLSGTLIATRPGDEPAAVASAEVNDLMRTDGALMLVGERAASVPGLLSAVSQLAQTTGVPVAWVPRRAGERGALDAGLLPSLLPGGRPVSDAAARVDAAAIWGVESISDAPGLDAQAMVAAAAAGTLSALVVAGAELRDLPADGSKALQRADFVLALDTRAHEVTEFADVVLPVAAAPEKAGRFINWEGRERPFDQALRETQLLSDARVLTALRHAMGAPRGASTLAELRAQWQEFAGWSGTRVSPPEESPHPANGAIAPGGLLLSTWQPLLSSAALQQDEPYLAATAHGTELSLDAAAAASLGLSEGDLATVSTAHGSTTAQTRVAEVAPGTVVVTGDVASSLRAVSGDEVSVKGVS